MIQGRYYDALAVKKTDLLLTENINVSAPDIMQEFYNLINNEGYIIYDVVAESGFANLAGKTVGKYLCVWRAGDPSGTYSLLDSYFSIHTDVITFAIRIDSFNVFEKTVSVDLDFTAGSYDDLTLKHGEYVIKDMGKVDFLTVENCKLTNEDTSNVVFESLEMDFVHYIVASVANPPDLELDNTTPATYTNCIFDSSSNGATLTFNIPTVAGGVYFRFINCVFTGFTNSVSSELLQFRATGGNLFDFQNCKIDTDTRYAFFDAGGGVPEPTDPIYQIIKTDHIPSANNPLNYQLLPFTDNDRFIFEQTKLDDSLLDFNNFIEFNADFQAEYIEDRDAFFNRQTRIFYITEFRENLAVNDDLKKIHRDFLYLIRRDDVESDILNNKIIGFQLYESDGTTPSTFTSDENFCMLATSAQGNTIFLWIDNVIYQSILTDVQASTFQTYTITKVFQIWEIDRINNIRQIRKDESSIGIMSMTGSVRYNNWDTEIQERNS